MKKWALIILAITFALSAHAENNGKYNAEYLHMPANISLWEDYSIGDIFAKDRKVINYVSVNLLKSKAAKLRGIEAGLLSNEYTEDVFGIQAAGIANIVNEGGTGIQLAGLANVDDGFSGIQIAGLANIVDESFFGIQMSGLAGVVDGPGKGIQVSGLANVVDDSFHGFQVSGLANVVDGTGRGIQISTLANIVDNTFIGIQASGLANVVDGESKGTQVSGLANIVDGSFHGFQVSGLANVIDGYGKSIQIAALANVVDDDFLGIQASGLANVIDGEGKGIQLSGFASVVDGNFTGIQASGFANVADGEFRGLQAGFLNAADNIDVGVQAGIINKSDKDGVIPLGIASFVEDTPTYIDVWKDEGRFLYTGFRSGTETIYNVAFLGVEINDPFRWSLGWEIGLHKGVSEKVYLETGVGVQHINENEFWTSEKNMLGSFKVIGGWQVTETMSLYAGPTLYYFISEVHDGSDLTSWSMNDEKSGAKWKRLWPGIIVGVRFEDPGITDFIKNRFMKF